MESIKLPQESFIEIKNQTGDVVIDGSFYNCALVRKFTVQNSSNAQPRTIQVTFEAEPGTIPPILAVSPNIPCTVQGPVASGNVYTWQISTERTNSQSGLLSVDCFIFSRPEGGSTFGIQLFKADTSLLYDANANYMRVIDSIFETSDLGTVTKTYPGVSAVAFLASSVGFSLGCDGGGGTYIRTFSQRGVRISGNQLTRETIGRSQNSGAPCGSADVKNNTTAQWLVIDVTGM